MWSEASCYLLISLIIIAQHSHQNHYFTVVSFECKYTFNGQAQLPSTLTVSLSLSLPPLPLQIVESCREGLSKPDARIFQLCLHRLGVSAQEAVFLDDLQFNVQAAADLGITSIKVR